MAKHSKHTEPKPKARVPMPKANPRTKAQKPSDALTSVRVGDMRKPPAPRPRGKNWAVRFLLGMLVLVALGSGAVYLYVSDVLGIEEVRVSGIRHLTAEDISQLAAVPASTTLLRVDTPAIEKRILANSWVKNVSIKRNFPHTLELVIEERPIDAIVEVTSVEAQTVDSWAISKDGMWLMRIPPAESEEAAGLSAQIYEDAASVLHITDVPLDVQPEAGKPCNDESVLNALAIVSGFSTTLADQVVVVSATDTVNTLLTLENGIQIAFGTSEDIREKERVCLKLMEEYPDQISYINVRVVDRPTWRAINSW